MLVDGADITGCRHTSAISAWYFQNYALFPYMTVAQNIAFPLKMRRLPRGEICSRGTRVGHGAAGCSVVTLAQYPAW